MMNDDVDARSTMRATTAGETGTADDPRLAFVYQEALRGLLQQQAAVESIRNRAATLVFAASFVTSLLGGRALADGLNGAWEWLGVVVLFSIGALTCVLLWPYYRMSFRFDAQDLLEGYVDRTPPATLSEMHRSLALHIRSDWQSNGRLIRRMREAFQVALVLLLLDILVWLFAVAAVSG
jgi:uncharacterized MAPEG superfamily protein